MLKEESKEIKKGKFKPITLIFFIIAFLFLLFVIFLYTPWFKNSRYYKIYQIQKTTDSLPSGSVQRKAYELYLQCLKSNQKTCSFNYATGSGPTPGAGPM